MESTSPGGGVKGPRRVNRCSGAAGSFVARCANDCSVLVVVLVDLVRLGVSLKSESQVEVGNMSSDMTRYSVVEPECVCEDAGANSASDASSIRRRRSSMQRLSDVLARKRKENDASGDALRGLVSFDRLNDDASSNDVADQYCPRSEPPLGVSLGISSLGQTLVHASDEDGDVGPESLGATEAAFLLKRRARRQPALKLLGCAGAATASAEGLRPARKTWAPNIAFSRESACCRRLLLHATSKSSILA